MASQTNLKKDVLVLNLEQQLEETSQELFQKSLAEITEREAYEVLLTSSKLLMNVSDQIDGKKKIY